MRQIVITGANGYIGRHLAETAVAHGYRVVCLGRSSTNLPDGCEHVAWSLGEAFPVACVDPTPFSIVHLAHDWANTPGADGATLNETGTRTLLESARPTGLTRFVFASSQSSRKDAQNQYGRIKFGIEQAIAAPDTVSARIGLVYGGPRTAQFGLLCKLVSTLPFLPMITPGRGVQPIRLDELCEGILKLAESDACGWKGLAAGQPVSFRGFLKTLARNRFGRSIGIAPVPLQFALLGASVSAAVPFLPTVDKERIYGLAGTPVMECKAHLEEIGLVVRPLEAGLRESRGFNRALLVEAHTLLKYVLRSEPRADLMRRYARAVQTVFAHENALALSPVLIARPSLFRFCEPLAKSMTAARRVALARNIAEQSPEGDAAMCAYSGSSRATGLLRLAIDLALDVVALPVRLVAQRVSH